MPKLLITFFIFFSIFSYSQDSSISDYEHDFNIYNRSTKSYKIYQFIDNDSLNIKLVKTIKFDDKGHKKFESTNNYKFSKLTGIENFITKFFYKKNLLLKTEITYPNSADKYYSHFKYNNSNQLILITAKKFGTKKKIKKRNKGELLDDEICETRLKWTTDFKKYFEYDKSGRLIKTTVPEKFNMSQNTYHYFYNPENNLIKITSYDKERLVWDEYREYHNKNDYDYTRIWIDYDFKISEICRDIGKVNFKYDDENILREISKPDYTGIRGNIKIKFYYNNEKQLQKVEIISVDNKIELTSLYIYD